MQVLFVAGYDNPSYHRKVELLADEPDFSICHVTIEGYDRPSGDYLSASGQRSYSLRTFPVHYLGRQGDPHRGYLWPPHYAIPTVRPDLIHIESDVETLGTAQVALARAIWAPRSKLIGYSWQNLVRPRRLAVRLLSRLVLQATDHVVCASTEAADVLRREGYRRGTTIMPLVGVDQRYFRPMSSLSLRADLRSEGFVIGFVGRLVPEKGVDLLLLACSQMTVPAQVLIVGQGPETARLQSLAESLGLSAYCHFAGAVSHDMTAKYLNAMDVLVLPSRTTVHWKEQFGRVLVEAMACGIPVVGAASGAIPEVIGDAGLTFPEGDAEALAAALARLAGDSTMAGHLAAAGRARVQAHFSVERLASRLADLWRSLARDVRP
jgi:glycosyltransferase involved in cell wall biosynthesis